MEVSDDGDGAPRRVRGTLRERLAAALRALRGVDPAALTTAEGWEHYARSHAGPGQLGDEWSRPAELGLDPDAGELVPTLDRQVLAPALAGTGTLLEIGAGGGRWTAALRPHCRRLIAADTSPTMLALLRRRFAGNDGVEYLHLDGQGLAPLADASVDAVFSFDVFVHLSHWDVFNYLREIARVLRPGGRAVIHHGHVLSELGWANFLSELPYTVNRHIPFGNFSVMTPGLMQALAERAGLAVEACRTDVVPRDAIALLRKARPASGNEVGT